MNKFDGLQTATLIQMGKDYYTFYRDTMFEVRRFPTDSILLDRLDYLSAQIMDILDEVSNRGKS